MTNLYLKNTLLFAASLGIALSLSAAPELDAITDLNTNIEYEVEIIKLAPPLNHKDIEISGLAWCADTLIVVPQYPERFVENAKSYLYGISKKVILDYVRGKDRSPISAKPIRVFENNIREKMSLFEGFEAIACSDTSVWLSIEAQNFFGTHEAYIVPADPNLTSTEPSISIRTDQIRRIKSQSGIQNKGEEAIVLYNKHLVSLHEVNDKRMVPFPKAHRIETELGTQSEISMEHLPYRLTDATDVDNQGRFWVINYQYSGDKFNRGADDPIKEKYGVGSSHKQYYNTERLVEFEFGKNSVIRSERPPIQLKMNAKEGRNWEGIARLNNIGFLIATDKHPDTIMGFVRIKSDK